MYQPARMMEEYTTAWLLTPWLQSTWGDGEHIIPAVLFVSRRVRAMFLECMREQGGIAWFPCASVVYELHVHSTPERQPAMTPALPMHWEVVVGEERMDGCVPCTDLWKRSVRAWGTGHLHEDAQEVMPNLHDGSLSPYDFDMHLRDLDLLMDLDLGSLDAFYHSNVVPMVRVLERLRRAEWEYRVHTHTMGLRSLGVLLRKK
jgi:hypothetical protein